MTETGVPMDTPPDIDLKKEAKTIARHSSVYMFGNILNKIVAFLMIPIYTRFLVPSDYGIIELLSLTTDVIGTLISVGIGAAMYRFYFDYKSEKDRSEVVTTALLTFGAIALISLLLLSLCSPLLATGLLDSRSHYYYFYISFCSLWFNTILQMGYSYLRIKQQSLPYLLYSLARLLVGLSLNIYLVAILRIGVLGVLLSTLISSILITLILIVPILARLGLHFSLPKCKGMLRYGAPLIPANLAAFVVHASDRYFIKHFVGLADTGIYSLSYKFGNIPNNFVAAPFMQIWEVRLFALYKERTAGKVFGQIFTHLCFLLFFVGLVISVLAKDLIMIMSNPSYWAAYELVPIIIAAYVVFSFQYYFNMGIYFTRQTKYLAYINGSNSIVNLILNWYLIRDYGVWGAAIATLACMVYKIVITYFIGNRLYKIHIEILRVLKMVAIATGIYFLCSNITISHMYISLVLKSMIVCVFPVLLYIINFYTDEEVSMIKSGFLKLQHLVLTSSRKSA